jgi:hypothetical protein
MVAQIEPKVATIADAPSKSIAQNKKGLDVANIFKNNSMFQVELEVKAPPREFSIPLSDLLPEQRAQELRANRVSDLSLSVSKVFSDQTNRARYARRQLVKDIAQAIGKSHWVLSLDLDVFEAAVDRLKVLIEDATNKCREAYYTERADFERRLTATLQEFNESQQLGLDIESLVNKKMAGFPEYEDTRIQLSVNQVAFIESDELRIGESEYEQYLRQKYAHDQEKLDSLQAQRRAIQQQQSDIRQQMAEQIESKVVSIAAQIDEMIADVTEQGKDTTKMRKQRKSGLATKIEALLPNLRLLKLMQEGQLGDQINRKLQELGILLGGFENTSDVIESLHELKASLTGEVKQIKVSSAFKRLVTL